MAIETDPATLTIENLDKEFETPTGPLAVVKDVSFTLAPGETMAIVGPSGAGKSTLLNMIGSLEKPTSGSIRLGEIDVTRLEGEALADFRSERVGFVFQDHHLLPQCSAIENVMLPTLPAGKPEGSVERAAALLERVGLGERIDSSPSKLSGGERQRVAIARAMINEPPLLLCDEPTGNLDHETGDQIGSLFVELASEKSVMLIVVTHNLELAKRFGHVMEILRDP